MKISLSKILSILLPIFFTTIVYAESANTPMSLSACLDYAVQHNPGLLAVKQDITTANARLQQAKSAQLPTISSEVSYQNYHELPVFITSFGEFASGWKETYDLQLSITQPLFTWGKITKSVQQAGYQVQISRAAYRQKEQELVYTVKQSFYQVLLSQELVRVNQEAVEVATAHLENARQQFQQGTISNYEVLRSEVELANSKPDLINAQNALKLAIVNLATVLGLKEIKSLEITGSLTATDTAAITRSQTSSPMVDYTHATTQAFLNRPEWNLVLLNEKYRELAIPIAATGSKPMVTLTGLHDRKSDTLDTDLGPWLHYSTAIVGVSWSLYDGWATKAKVAQERSNLAKLRFEKQQLELAIKLEVEQALLNIRSAQEVIVSQEKTIEQAKESYRLSESRYRNGVGTNLEVLDTKVALTRAKTNFAQAQYNFLVALAQLDKVTGIERL